MRMLLSELNNLDWNSLKFARKDEAIIVGCILVAVWISALVFKRLRRSYLGRDKIAVLAILSVFKRPRRKFIRHIPLAVFIVSLPFFFVALADPYVSFVQEKVSYPGRKIAILIDASDSMNTVFEITKLKQKSKQRFFTAVAAAEYFMKVRIDGKYRDIMALIEFGNESHIITPFTNDYRNILTSISLISEPEERERFRDGGTIIIKAIDQSVELFRTYNFLGTAGNLIVLISDGEDNQAILEGKSLNYIVGEVIKNNIPIYFIRVNFEKELLQNYGDKLWKDAVEKTGGRFYPAANEDVILKAIKDIDKAALGSIKTTRYTTKKPLFQPFIATAIILWATACLLIFSFKCFRKFP